ncbi:UPF0565 protein C2orf69 homolog [Eumeta japonica]|uniref:UPF0565 protein C2orf69 homolog n=1 Tax=Eumeta variegata TaxID=151549 RepID=A0A4C1WQV0_EUMVA|nr:UPF0565 protein C2orf69 homolog [Eumeta japonica]
MCQVRESRPYITWSLVSAAKSLSHQFPLHHILVVRAVRLEAHTVACYDNFVPSSSVGIPDHTPTYSALQHLERKCIKSVPPPVGGARSVLRSETHD